MRGSVRAVVKGAACLDAVKGVISCGSGLVVLRAHHFNPTGRRQFERGAWQKGSGRLPGACGRLLAAAGRLPVVAGRLF